MSYQVQLTIFLIYLVISLACVYWLTERAWSLEDYYDDGAYVYTVSLVIFALIGAFIWYLGAFSKLF